MASLALGVVSPLLDETDESRDEYVSAEEALG